MLAASFHDARPPLQELTLPKSHYMWRTTGTMVAGLNGDNGKVIVGLEGGKNEGHTTSNGGLVVVAHDCVGAREGKWEEEGSGCQEGRRCYG
ncbi:3-methylcrotonyl-CoA carboxylase [Sesbania bispinosa]|nr:3-methylcrotonyl-CoA carboxylase [Sesbania bispinosa]